MYILQLEMYISLIVGLESKISLVDNTFIVKKMCIKNNTNQIDTNVLEQQGIDN